jgi:hypothetical protein
LAEPPPTALLEETPSVLPTWENDPHGDVVVFGPPISEYRVKVRVVGHERGKPLIVEDDFL